jgi:hypothetical protein
MQPVDQSLTVRQIIGAEWGALENALITRGAPLSLYWRAVWADAFGDSPVRLAVFDGRQAPLLAVAVQQTRSRSLPGHRFWRLRQMDPATSTELMRAAMAFLLQSAREDSRVLRVSVDLYSRDGAARTEAGRMLSELGFEPVVPPRDYPRTLILDLPTDLADLWESRAYSTVRRNVRVAERAPLDLRVIDDPALVPRMAELLDSTFARTGAQIERPDFAGMMTLGRADPNASRLVGMFHSEATGPDALVAYAWALRHGDYCVYDIAASSREPAIRKYSLAHALVWELIRWSHAGGARWFDFGGVSAGTRGDGDPLGGISEFKRTFCKEAPEDVREEWQLEPRRLRAWAARSVSSAAATAAALLARTRRAADSSMQRSDATEPS